MNVRVHSLAASSQCELDSAWSHRHPSGTDTSSIYFSSGMDAAGLNRSDVSVSAETRHQKCTRMYTFDDAATQIPAYLQKVYTLQKAPISNIIIL